MSSLTLGCISHGFSFFSSSPCLLCQVAVGGQICWQSDRLTHLGYYSSTHSFPRCCIPAGAGATDLLKPWHPLTKTFVQNETLGHKGKQKQKYIPEQFLHIINHLKQNLGLRVKLLGHLIKPKTGCWNMTPDALKFRSSWKGQIIFCLCFCENIPG